MVGVIDVIINADAKLYYKNLDDFGQRGIAFLILKNYLWDNAGRLAYGNVYVRLIVDYHHLWQMAIPNHLLNKFIWSLNNQGVGIKLTEHINMAKYDNIKLREPYSSLNDIIAAYANNMPLNFTYRKI